MKRREPLLLVVVVAIALAGCGSSSSVSSTATTKSVSAAVAPSWSKSGPPVSIPEPEWKAAGATQVFNVNAEILGRKLNAGAAAGKCVVEKIGVTEGLRLLALLVALHKHEAAAEEAAHKALAACKA